MVANGSVSFMTHRPPISTLFPYTTLFRSFLDQIARFWRHPMAFLAPPFDIAADGVGYFEARWLLIFGFVGCGILDIGCDKLPPDGHRPLARPVGNKAIRYGALAAFQMRMR